MCVHAAAGSAPCGRLLHALATRDKVHQQGGRLLQARSVPRVSLSYKQRPAPYSIIDLRNMPNFVPNNRCPTLLVARLLQCYPCYCKMSLLGDELNLLYVI